MHDDDHADKWGRKQINYTRNVNKFNLMKCVASQAILFDFTMEKFSIERVNA